MLKGQLSIGDECLALANHLGVMVPCDAGDRFAIFDNGQIRTAVAGCLTASATRVISAECTADSNGEHVTGAVPVSQAFVF